jgi:hypothetical protein
VHLALTIPVCWLAINAAFAAWRFAKVFSVLLSVRSYLVIR